MNKKNYKRILLKLSGELLLGDQHFGINYPACQKVASSLHQLQKAGFQIGVVIGGGNVFRGIDLQSMGMARKPADQIGMVATLMNGIALQQAISEAGSPVKLMSALECPKVAESFNWDRALGFLLQGEIILFVGGTGSPFFTTDTAAALRASEIEADILLKATKVDGVYDSDPIKNPGAKKYQTISYSQVLAEKLQVIDATAITLCRNSNIPIFVFNMKRLFEGNVEKILSDLTHGTLINGS